MASMVKAICRVFLDPGNTDMASECGFKLPSLTPLTTWKSTHVAMWLESLTLPGDHGRGGNEHGEGSSDADSAEGAVREAGACRPAAGVTADIKKWLLQSFSVGMDFALMRLACQFVCTMPLFPQPMLRPFYLLHLPAAFSRPVY